MSSRNRLAFAKPRDEAARTAAKSRLSSLGTTPAITNSVHLHPCIFEDMNSMALPTSGRSVVNSSSFARNIRATASSRSHNMRKWPVFSSGPPQKLPATRHRAGDFLPPPSDDLHGGEIAVSRLSSSQCVGP